MQDEDNRYVVPGGAGAQEAQEPGAATSPARQDPNSALHLDWSHGPGGVPWRLGEVSMGRLAPRGLTGVFLVWCAAARHTDAPRWVYVGESRDVGARLLSVGGDPRLRTIQDGAKLFVSWAPVASLHRRGVTCFLNQILAPLVPEPHEIDRPISVNLPA